MCRFSAGLSFHLCHDISHRKIIPGAAGGIQIPMPLDRQLTVPIPDILNQLDQRCFLRRRHRFNHIIALATDPHAGRIVILRVRPALQLLASCVNGAVFSDEEIVSHPCPSIFQMPAVYIVRRAAFGCRMV